MHFRRIKKLMGNNGIQKTAQQAGLPDVALRRNGRRVAQVVNGMSGFFRRL